MTNATHPVTEVYGTSTESIDGAIRSAISATKETIRNLEWFEVTQIRGQISETGDVKSFQVGIKLGFRLDR